MYQVIVKNNTASGIYINDLGGYYIAASESDDVAEVFNPYEISISHNLADMVASSAVTINNGAEDLDIEPALLHIGVKDSFRSLLDTPTTYVGAAPKAVKVNPTETGVDFVQEYKQMSWHKTITYNGRSRLVGWYIDEADDVYLQSDGPIQPSSQYSNNSFFVMNMTSVSGAPFTVTISGTSMSDITFSTYECIDSITVTGTGYYKTNYRFVNTPSFSIPEDNKSCIFDLKKTNPFSFGGTKVSVQRIRLEWVPDGEDWELVGSALHIHANGYAHELMGGPYIFSSEDIYLRASQDEPGIFDVSVFGAEAYVDGSIGEGTVIRFDSTFIGALTLMLWYKEAV